MKQDEFPRAGCTIEGFQKLRPAFVKDGSGTVTAGNASGVLCSPRQVRYPNCRDTISMSDIIFYAIQQLLMLQGLQSKISFQRCSNTVTVRTARKGW